MLSSQSKVLYQLAFTTLGNMSWRSFSLKQAIATQAHQTLKFIPKVTCRHLTIKLNSGYQ